MFSNENYRIFLECTLSKYIAENPNKAAIVELFIERLEILGNEGEQGQI
jgi:hypothetical protein